MAGRQRRRAPRVAALISVAAAWLLGACSGSVEAVSAPSEPRALVLARPEAAPRKGPQARAPHPRDGALEARFEAIVRHRLDDAVHLSRGTVKREDLLVSAHVRELDSGARLVRLRSDQAQRPASNLKLMTSAAALVLFGPGVEFLTPIDAVGPIAGDTLAGDLVLRAAGDPLWSPEGDPSARLDRAVSELRARGLRRVTGHLILDEGTFLEPGPGPGWPPANQHWADYCARSGGFSTNGGVFVAHVTAGRAGEAARLDVLPRPHGLRKNYGVTTVAKGRLDVQVGATTSTVTVKGSLPESVGTFDGRFSQPDPVDVFGHVFLGALERGGIEVREGVLRRRGEPEGVRLAEVRSSLDALYEPINTESENGVADQLFLALGHSLGGGGTRAGGARAIALALERLDVPTDGLVQVDGSGLSRDNRVTAEQLTALLAAVLESGGPGAKLFVDSLASFGQDGTLERRLNGTSAEGRAHGKTGWIAGVSALSGCLETLDGRTLVFSILVEYPKSQGGLNTKVWKPMQDELVLLMVEDSAP